jgi:hypothetical protein
LRPEPRALNPPAPVVDQQIDDQPGLNTERNSMMCKLIGALSAVAIAAALLTTNAQAWDHCGHGAHRTLSGYCVSNYGGRSGCPYGYHLGWNIRACVPN